MSPAASRDAGEKFGRFSLVGVVNSVVGYAVIFAGLAAGLSPYLSNLAGYLAGLTCSFFLTRTFVFSAQGHSRRQVFRFLAAFSVAYAANLIVLHAWLQLGGGDIAAQVLAGIVYLFIMFIVSRSWVFGK